MATTSPQRILTLDIVRGVAVMGILAMNIVAFAMPIQAYMNPFAYGTQTVVDLAVFAFNFVFIDGKMRGLFSFMFGASMLLVIELALAKGQSARSVTFRRQLWLLVFGMIHFYLIWFGDILIGYALIGMAAWFFRNKSVRTLIAIGAVLLAVQLGLMGVFASMVHSLAPEVAAGTASAEQLEMWEGFTRDFAVPSEERLSEIMALHLGPWTGIVHQQVTEHLVAPFVFTFLLGWETLGYMLFGMAALKSGFFAGAWTDRAYVRVALIGFAISIPAYAVLLALHFGDGFSPEGIWTWTMAATVPVRPVMVLAYAALIILLTRNGGWLVDRIAAAGRAAFTNYLGTSIIMTFVFYGWGLGLFGALGRAELWLVVLAMWVVMLAWSKPWLDRYRYGPFEWLWRSLVRWQPQPMPKARRARYRCRRLDPTEALVGGLAAESGGIVPPPGQKRIGRLVEQFDGPLED
jgi:uncharacterized protein